MISDQAWTELSKLEAVGTSGVYQHQTAHGRPRHTPVILQSAAPTRGSLGRRYTGTCRPRPHGQRSRRW